MGNWISGSGTNAKYAPNAPVAKTVKATTTVAKWNPALEAQKAAQIAYDLRRRQTNQQLSDINAQQKWAMAAVQPQLQAGVNQVKASLAGTGMLGSTVAGKRVQNEAVTPYNNRVQQLAQGFNSARLNAQQNLANYGIDQANQANLNYQNLSRDARDFNARQQQRWYELLASSELQRKQLMENYTPNVPSVNWADLSKYYGWVGDPEGDPHMESEQYHHSGDPDVGDAFGKTVALSGQTQGQVARDQMNAYRWAALSQAADQFNKQLTNRQREFGTQMRYSEANPMSAAYQAKYGDTAKLGAAAELAFNWRASRFTTYTDKDGKVQTVVNPNSLSPEEMLAVIAAKTTPNAQYDPGIRKILGLPDPNASTTDVGTAIGTTGVPSSGPRVVSGATMATRPEPSADWGKIYDTWNSDTNIDPVTKRPQGVFHNWADYLRATGAAIGRDWNNLWK